MSDSDEVLVSVDPGVRNAGLAVFRDGVLVDVKFIFHDNGIGPAQIVGMARELFEETPGAHKIVVERMNFRAGRSDAATDLMDVMAVVGAYLGLLGNSAGDAVGGWIEFAEPSEWTSGRPKAQNHARIRSRLSEEEKTALEAGLYRCPKANHKELLDAVGIGLYALKRL